MPTLKMLKHSLTKTRSKKTVTEGISRYTSTLKFCTKWKRNLISFLFSPLYKVEAVFLWCRL